MPAAMHHDGHHRARHQHHHPDGAQDGLECRSGRASSPPTTRRSPRLPGGATEGFYCMTPALYAYPDDPRPAVQDFAKKLQGELRPRSELPRRGRLHRRAIGAARLGQCRQGPDRGRLHQGRWRASTTTRTSSAPNFVRTGPAPWLYPLVPDGGQGRPLGAGRAVSAGLLIRVGGRQ